MTDAAELVKLAACPFCGGIAEIERKGSTRVSNIVACTDCGCRLESGDVFDPTASWNRRAAQQDGAREAAIEECAKVAQNLKLGWLNGTASTIYGQGYQTACEHLAAEMLKLKSRPEQQP